MTDLDSRSGSAEILSAAPVLWAPSNTDATQSYLIRRDPSVLTDSDSASLRFELEQNPLRLGHSLRL
jgi:hypothetical protein